MNQTLFKGNIGESYTKTVLDCGLQVFVLEKPEFNSSYAVFGTKYGSIDTCFSLNDGEFVSVPEGIAHFLEHKLFESEDGDAFSRFAETGASANAFTSFDRTCYLFSCSDKFYENLDILLDFVQHPYFTKQTVEKEQGIIGQEIRMYDDSPTWCAFFNMLKALYANHPVKIDIAGTVESISNITAELLYSCYNTFYDLSNMFVCIAGNVDTDLILQHINANLKNVNNNKIVSKKVEEPKTVCQSYIETDAEVAIDIFSLGYKLDGNFQELSLLKKLAFQAALEVIFGDSSVLVERLTEMELINDEFEAELFVGRDYASVIVSGESSDPKKVRKEIDCEIENIINHGFDAELLEAVKRSMYGDCIRRFNSNEAIVMQFVEAAINDFDLFNELDLIKEIGYDDVMKCVEQLESENSSLSVVVPKK